MTTKKRSSWVPAVAVVLAVVVFVLLFWKGPWWVDGAHLRKTKLGPADGVVITGFRTALVAVAVALTAGIGLVYTHRNHQATLDQLEQTRQKDLEQAALTREGQITDRYVDAIKLLSAQNSGGLTERLGGIYALERILRDSERDRPTVIQVLAAFIRQHAPRPDDEQLRRMDTGELDVPRLRDDVQAALTVLARRPEDNGRAAAINLSYTALWGCDLQEGHFVGADFRGVLFGEAHLQEVDFRSARLGGAVMTKARLHGADLRGARMVHRDAEAQLHVRQLRHLRFDARTRLPDSLKNLPVVAEMLASRGPDGWTVRSA